MATSVTSTDFNVRRAISSSIDSVYATCCSIMNRIELCPRLVFGPYSMKKFGNCGMLSPR